MGLIHALLIILPVSVGISSQLQPIFWAQAILQDFGGLFLLYSGLVTIATLLSISITGRGKLDLLFSLLALGLLIRAHGIVVVDVVNAKVQQPARKGVPFTLAVIGRKAVSISVEKLKPVIASADLVIAIDNKIPELPPEFAITSETVSIDGRTIFVSSKLPSLEPAAKDFGEPAGAAIISTLELPSKQPVKIGVLSLPSSTDPISFGVSRVVSRRVANVFRHVVEPSVVVGEFSSTIYGQPCKIFLKAGEISHHVAPGLPSLFQAPIRSCTDTENILASSWEVEFLRSGIPGVTWAKLYR